MLCHHWSNGQSVQPIFCDFLAVPDAPPQNVAVHSPSTGTITIRWSPPPVEVQYGIITGYEISFGVAESNIAQNSFTSDLSITRTGLLSNTTYLLSVVAVNGAGISDSTTTLNFNLRKWSYLLTVLTATLIVVAHSALLFQNKSSF